MVIPTRDQFQTAAKQRHQAARELLGSSHSPKPQVACYLNLVALECLLKARIMDQAMRPRMPPLKEVLGEKKYEQLFGSSAGHSLSLLAEESSLRRGLKAAGRDKILQGTAWKRMCSSGRPYSLRYGTEKLSTAEAQDEVTAGTEIFAAMENAR